MTFITFEGGEGAGKTTLIEKIAFRLSGQNRSVLRTREPGGTRVGEEIRKILLERREGEPLSPYAELSLFLASRAQHLSEIIKPALEKGAIVLCDRFNDSSIAYQGMARGLGMDEVEKVCRFMSGGIEPALTLYLDIDPEMGLARAKRDRGGQDRMESEAIAFHKKIREAYLRIHKKHPKRFHLLDAAMSPERVFEEAMKIIDASHV
ncbi:MAG: dTMP kinase [Chlamydiae bacterium RIFCSPHIGHO2_12_FULL_49_9]|nr:MAG: dTMP kinase [Chlamydiae bacterium RIFCSPHIGHO2_12_FULL_49_9]